MSDHASKAARPRAVAEHATAPAERTQQLLGARIRSLRQRRHMTIEALAEIAGTTKSLLSKIERGESSPSIGIAMRIGQSFGMALGELLGETETAGRASVMRAADRPSFMRGKGNGVATVDTQPLVPGRFLKTMEPVLMRPRPGLDDDHFSQHPGEEFVMVLQGSVELAFSDQSYVLEKGDTAYFDAAVLHCIRPLGDEQAEVLSVVQAR